MLNPYHIGVQGVTNGSMATATQGFIGIEEIVGSVALNFIVAGEIEKEHELDGFVLLNFHVKSWLQFGDIARSDLVVCTTLTDITTDT